MATLVQKSQSLMNRMARFEALPALLLRLYLAPIFWMAGTQKLAHFRDTVSWFGNPEWGLGLPAPTFMAAIVTCVELIGAVCLMLGVATRLICIPLSITMLVAALTVHWQNGWLAIATGDGLFATERTQGAIERLDHIKTLLKTHGNYEWLTENGSVVILNNGIEFAATYFIMLLALMVLGGGRWISLDYWIARFFPAQR